MVAGLRKLDYSKPLAQMRAYLDGDGRLAVHGADRRPSRRSGCSPRSARRCSSCPPSAADGAHPYWTTPEHTAAGPPDPRAGQAAVRRAEGGADDRRRPPRARAADQRDRRATRACRTTATTGCGSGFTEERDRPARARASSTPWWRGATRTDDPRPGAGALRRRRHARLHPAAVAEGFGLVDWACWRRWRPRADARRSLCPAGGDWGHQSGA